MKPYVCLLMVAVSILPSPVMGFTEPSSHNIYSGNRTLQECGQNGALTNVHFEPQQTRQLKHLRHLDVCNKEVRQFCINGLAVMPDGSVVVSGGELRQYNRRNKLIAVVSTEHSPLQITHYVEDQLVMLMSLPGGHYMVTLNLVNMTSRTYTYQFNYGFTYCRYGIAIIGRKIAISCGAFLRIYELRNGRLYDMKQIYIKSEYTNPYERFERLRLLTNDRRYGKRLFVVRLLGDTLLCLSKKGVLLFSQRFYQNYTHGPALYRTYGGGTVDKHGNVYVVTISTNFSKIAMFSEDCDFRDFVFSSPELSSAFQAAVYGRFLAVATRDGYVELLRIPRRRIPR